MRQELKSLVTLVTACEPTIPTIWSGAMVAQPHAGQIYSVTPVSSRAPHKSNYLYL
jgi:hypothetical protein